MPRKSAEIRASASVVEGIDSYARKLAKRTGLTVTRNAAADALLRRALKQVGRKR